MQCLPWKSSRPNKVAGFWDDPWIKDSQKTNGQGLVQMDFLGFDGNFMETKTNNLHSLKDHREWTPTKGRV